MKRTARDSSDVSVHKHFHCHMCLAV